uniref:Late blight resistance protein n=1 Tax=Solanum tuberosum TaxID=4113 RepID=M1AKB5_SOLTU
MVAKLVEWSFQRHRVCSIPSSDERVMPFESWAVGRGSARKFKGILFHFKKVRVRVLERKKRRREKEEKEKRRSRSFRQRSSWKSSGVIPIKVYVDGDGRLTGGDATKFFAMSNSPRPELK